ncbi:4Fe-4S dicluster domain-containing protein [Campylobacter concisus]|jgi:4Fe-4S ferredoxin, iron-sulfur-binding
MQSRRELFSKILGAKSAPKFITPPFFSGEFDCDGCDASCVNACEKELLSFENERVVFKVKKLGCDFCEECAKACQSIGKTTLNLNSPKSINAKVSIDVSSCLAWNDTICYNCLDACKFKAVEFLGVFRPIVNQNCVSCGECFDVCFKNSLQMEAL